jgi:P27 family predicted phage terminase small subunit
LLAERGIIARIDMASLAIYCQEFGRWQDAEEIVAKKGMHVKMKSGHIQDHPALMTARQAGKIVTRLAAEFGLTPSSRARIPAKAEEEPEELEI